MLLARGFAVTAATLLPVAAGLVASPLSAAESSAAAASAICADAADLTVLPSPIAPWKGAPLRVMVVAEKPVFGALSLIAPDGSVAATSSDRHGGGPYSWFAEIATPAAGTWHAKLALDHVSAGCGAITREIVVNARKPKFLQEPRRAVSGRCAIAGTARRNRCFRHGSRSYSMPHPTRICRGRCGMKCCATDRAISCSTIWAAAKTTYGRALRPDCADFVYFLRAYFAYKMALPFGYSNCSRGAGGKAPKCYQWFDIEHPEITRPAPPPEQELASSTDRDRFRRSSPKLSRIVCSGAAAAVRCAVNPAVPPAPPKPKRPTTFAEYLRDVGDVVHSGAVRVAASDDNTDFYSVPLTEEALRPGTVYADPYGHVLMLVHRVPEDERQTRRLSRRRCRTRRLDHAKAFLARQFPVRARSCARQPRVQAFPADRGATKTARCGGWSTPRSPKIPSTRIFRSIRHR